MQRVGLRFPPPRTQLGLLSDHPALHGILGQLSHGGTASLRAASVDTPVGNAPHGVAAAVEPCPCGSLGALPSCWGQRSHLRPPGGQESLGALEARGAALGMGCLGHSRFIVRL